MNIRSILAILLLSINKILTVNSININKQIDLLNKWSTNPDYTKLIKQKVIKIKKILENG